MYTEMIDFTTDAVVVTSGTPEPLPEFTFQMVEGATYYIEHNIRVSGGFAPPIFRVAVPAGSTGHYGGEVFGNNIVMGGPQQRLVGVVVAGADGEFTMEADVSSGSFTVEALAVMHTREFKT